MINHGLIDKIELNDNIIKEVILLPNDIDIAVILQNKRYKEINANIVILVENKHLELLNKEKIIENLNKIHRKYKLEINLKEFIRNYFLNLNKDMEILYNILFLK